MAGPWEDYKKPAAPKGPWEEYAKPKSAESYGPQPAIEEMAPDVSWKDRAIVQNLANDPKVAREFMSKKYPQYDVRSDEQSGRMTFTDKKSNKTYVLDPQTGAFSKDILNDIADVAFPVASGAAQTAAEAGGALLGGAAGSAVAPVAGTAAGALAGRSIGGGVAGAGMEALRQKLGQVAGIPQEMNGEDVAIAGGVSAALPLAGSALGKVYSAAKNTIQPSLMNWASGVPKQAIKDFQDKASRVYLMESQSKQALNKNLQKVMGSVGEGLQANKEKAWVPVKEALDTAEASGFQVTTNGAKALWEKAISEAQDKAIKLGTPAAKEHADTLAATYAQHIKDLPDAISPNQAQDLLQSLKEVSKPYTEKAIGSAYAPAMDATDRQLKYLGGQASKDLAEQLSSIPGVGKGKSLYDAAKAAQDAGETAFGTEEKAFSTLKNLGKDAKAVLKGKLAGALDNKAINNLERRAQAIQTAGYFANPAAQPLSSFGATSTSRTIPLAALGGSLGTLQGYQAGGGYSGAAAGGMAGAAAGAALGSPAMLKRFILMQRGLERAATKGSPAIYGGSKSAWEMMRTTAEGEGQ